MQPSSSLATACRGHLRNGCIAQPGGLHSAIRRSPAPPASTTSVPGSNPAARPKATGYRNESTTVGSFVICPIPLVVGNSWNGQPYLIQAFVYSTDGKPHPVSCTAVVGQLTNPDYPLFYSTKSETVDANDRWEDSNTVGQLFTWTAADFGGGSAEYTQLPSGGLLPSVTCSPSPQVELGPGKACRWSLILPGGKWGAPRRLFRSRMSAFGPVPRISGKPAILAGHRTE